MLGTIIASLREEVAMVKSDLVSVLMKKGESK